MNIEHRTSNIEHRSKALLILGATGTGKTPLGEFLEGNGLNGRRCVHFDFGSCLRAVADGTWLAPELTESDADFVRSVLESNALLEDGEFYIAKKTKTICIKASARISTARAYA